jgi:hypothetical protein
MKSHQRNEYFLINKLNPPLSQIEVLIPVKLISYEISKVHFILSCLKYKKTFNLFIDKSCTNVNISLKKTYYFRTYMK